MIRLRAYIYWNLAIWKSNPYDLYPIDTSYTNKMGLEAPFPQAIRYSSGYSSQYLPQTHQKLTFIQLVCLIVEALVSYWDE